jgi:hypothetical protein
MDPAGQSYKVGIKGADDNARMVRSLLVQAEEVLPIQGDDDPLLVSCEGEYLLVRDRLSCVACLLNRQDIMAEAA